MQCRDGLPKLFTSIGRERLMAEDHAPIVIAMTGASGARYGLRLIQCVAKAGRTVLLLLSDAARIVIETEIGWRLADDEDALLNEFCQRLEIDPAQLRFSAKRDWFSPAASGSSGIDQMVICPCSMGTLSSIAQGASGQLIERAADVMIKERKQLILMPRETPYSQIHLQNMLKLSQNGVLILPASPGFYYDPQTIEALIDFIVARILQHLGIEQTLLAKWGLQQISQQPK